MNFDEFRESMNTFWRDVQEESVSFKDPYIALDRLHALYKKFDDAERVMADIVIGEWALSEEQVVRHHALSLIDDFKIKEATDHLRRLASRLMAADGPHARDELVLVRRILKDLDDGLG
jgi:hypothetical protein